MAEPSTVAIVSAVVPYPSDAGKKVVLAGLTEYWVDRLGPDRVHYVLVGHGDEQLDASAVRLHHILRPSTPEQLLSLTWRTLLTRRHAIQESMLYAPRVRDELRATLASIGADLEIYDTIRMAQYAAEIAPRPWQRRVVYLDDLFSVRYARMLQLLDSRPDIELEPLGEFRDNVPASLAPLTGLRWVQRLLLGTERRLVARREVQAAREFSAALLVSPAEVTVLADRAGATTVRALPPAVDAPLVPRAYDGHPVFVLLGLLSLAHNHDAAMTFLSQTMPQVVRRLPDVRVHIVGRGASPELLAAAARWPDNVVVDGYVPDLDGLLSTACALLAPLRFGSGIKIKVIEALARGLPVLGTPFGAEGIASGQEHGVLVEPDLERHPGLMVELTDPGYNATLSAAARRQFAHTYAREAAYQRYDEVFAEPARTRQERVWPW